MKKVLLAIFAVIILAVIGSFVYDRQPQAATPVTPLTTQNLLNAVNTERAKYGAAPLKLDPRLNASAQAKADDEVKKGYFGHYCDGCLNGVLKAEDNFGHIEGNYSENLVQLDYYSVETAMESWNGSKPHHDAMIDKRYTLTGFGINDYQVVEHFYSPTQFHQN